MIFKKNNEYKEYSLIDAFKVFFYLLIVVAGVSFFLQITIIIVGGNNATNLLESERVKIIAYLLTPLTFITFYVFYNAKRKVKQTFAFGDGQKISFLPISVAMVLAIICIFMFTPFINLIDYGFSEMGYIVDNTLPLQEKMSSSGLYLLLGIIIFALLPAIAEELIFRGIIQKSLSTRLNGFSTVILTSIMFVLMHGSLQQTVYQFIVGILLSYVSYVGGSILYSIILHFLNNALVVLFSCFDIVEYLSYDTTVYYNIFSMIFPVMIFLLGCVLVGILFWVLKYLRNKNFFRYVKKSKKKNAEDDNLQVEKVGLNNLWKSMSYNEKVFMIFGFVIVGVVWLIQTIDGFL